MKTLSTVFFSILRATLLLGASVEASEAGSSVAGILPPDVMAFVSIRDAGPLIQTVGGGDAPGAFVGKLGLNDGVRKEMLDGLYGYRNQLGSMSVVFGGAPKHGGRVQYIVVGDWVAPEKAEEIGSLLNGLRGRLHREDGARRVDIHRVEPGTAPEEAGADDPFFIATYQHLFFMGTDRDLLKRVLVMAQEKRGETLAHAPSYKIVASRSEDARLFAYGAVQDLIRWSERPVLRSGDLKSFQTIAGLLGLWDTHTAGIALEGDGRGISITLDVDESGSLYSLLSTRNARKELDAFTPSGAFYVIGLSTSNAGEAWEGLKHHLYAVLSGIYEVKGMHEMGDSIKIIEKHLGFGFEETAATLGVEMCFFQDGDSPALKGHEVVGRAMAAKMKDPDRADALVGEILGGVVGSETYRNVTIHDTEERIFYARMDDVGIFVKNPGKEAVKASIDARNSEETIIDRGSYRTLTGELPGENVLRGYWDLHRIIHQEERLARSLMLGTKPSKLEELPLGFREWFDNLEVAAALTARDGKVGLRMVSSNELNVASLLRERFAGETAAREAADSGSWLLRHAAARSLSDQNMLLGLAMEDPSWRVGRAAVPNLDNQPMLETVARKARWERVRRAAIDRLEDQDVLADIALGADEASDRKTAVENLTSQKLLAEIARKDEMYYVRMAATRRLEDQTAFSKIAVEDPTPLVRKTAVEKLEDRELLAEIATRDEAEQVRLAAVHSDLLDQETLSKVAQEDKSDWVRGAAVRKITEQDVLARVALEDENRSVRRVAVENLTDPVLLAEVVERTEDPETHRQAEEKLNK